MKRFILILMILSLSFSLFGISIRDIQYTTDSSGKSPKENEIVTVSAIVSGEPYAFGGNIMFIHDAPGAWNGIMVDLGVHVDELVAKNVIISEGDSITVTGKVIEKNGMTQIAEVTSLKLEKAGVGCYPATLETTAGARQEKYEGCLLRIKDVIVGNVSADGEWEINDGTGVLKVSNQDMVSYFFWPEEYQSCLQVTGLIHFSDGALKLLPRLAWDIIEGPMKGESMAYTRIQRIQQVRYSDLLKTPTLYTDASYLDGIDTTIYVKGVVTMQTGIAYAGAGIKFILSDLHGGPWSGMLSYNKDSTIYPNMFVGDVIEMSGYVGEYVTSTWSNMTEFWLVGDVNLLGTAEVPDTPLVKTGDLRHPTTAEQWGNVFVRCEEAIIVDNKPQFEIMAIDDGSGSVLVRADSDSMSSRAGRPAYVSPPIMTRIKSITGWVYNCYGFHTDSTTYKLCPLYKQDVVLGEGPAILLKPFRVPDQIPKSSQDVVVSLTVSTLRTIEDAIVYYRVNNEGDFIPVDMVYAGDDIWSGTIPAQEDKAIVEYYFYVKDNAGDISVLPANYEEKHFSYKVLNSDPTIYDIQYTHAPYGNSPLEGVDVTFQATVLTDGKLAHYFTDKTNKGAIAVASAPGPWNGIWVLASLNTLEKLHEGDLIEVTGKVTENHEDYYKWQENTWVTGTVKWLLDEFPLDPTPVTLEELNNNFEAYEGVLVSLEDPTEITEVNEYDITVTDGNYSFLLDDDMAPDSILKIYYMENAVFNKRDTLAVGDSINTFTGVGIFSFSTAKIEMRKASDVSYTIVKKPETSLAALPSAFALKPNYPNPFNPVTTLRFDLPSNTKIRLQIFDLKGRLVEELINTSLNAGYYEVQWNAANYSSGVYICRMMTPEYCTSHKMLLLK